MKDFLLSASGSLGTQELERRITEILSRLPERRAFALEAETSSFFVTRFLALLKGGHTVFPVPQWLFRDPIFREKLAAETGTDFSFWALTEEFPSPAAGSDLHPELAAALSRGEARFIVRTSGSSGKFKFVVHDPRLFVEKYHRIGPHFEKTFLFSPADSIAGIETLLEARTHGAPVVIPSEKLTPSTVLKTLTEFGVDYFQTTPSFLNLMLMAGKFREAPPVGLRKIAFGSEPAQRRVLTELQTHWPGIELVQTYGMSEIGILRTLGAPDPALVSFDQGLNPVRLSAGLLEVKSATPLCAHLNFQAEFTLDGWFRTHDRASVRNELYVIEGREGDLINVGGRKFFPAELEEILMRLPEVLDCTIRFEAAEFLGQALIAELVIAPESEEREVRKSLKKFLEAEVPPFMHPHRFRFLKAPPGTERFKKIRRTT